jgi:hypothetical protein
MVRAHPLFKINMAEQETAKVSLPRCAFSTEYKNVESWIEKSGYAFQRPARADRVQMETSERVKMLEKQQHRAGCVNPCERNML